MVSQVMSPEEFRAIRKRLGFTQAELAERLRVTNRAVVKWESGEAPISIPLKISMEYWDRQKQIEAGKPEPRLYVVNAYPSQEESDPIRSYIVCAESSGQALAMASRSDGFNPNWKTEVSVASDVKQPAIWEVLAVVDRSDFEG